MPINPNVLDPSKPVPERYKTKKQEYWLSSVDVTTTSGKQYHIDRQELDWIKNRYKQDNADSYGYDTADQQAKAAGQLSAKVKATYTKSAVDQQLAQMGLPSQKNIDKYVGQFQQWNTGGIGKVFGNSLSSQDWSSIGNLYKQSWKYTDSAEDQMRKQKGLMPSALEANYTDTEVDDQLKAGGLPSFKDFNTYLGQYNNQRGIDALYANAAASYTAMRTRQDVNTKEYVKDDNKNYTLVVDPATGRTETKTGRDWYAQAFYDELGRTDKDGNLVYGDIMPLLKPSKTGEESYIDPTKSYIEQMDNLYKAKAKEDKAEFDGHSAFSYDDFAKHYPEYYDAYIKDMPWSDSQTIDDRLGVIKREADAQAEKDFYDITDKWFDDDKGIVEFVERYQKDYPPPTPGNNGEPDYKSYYETMFSNMLAHGVSKNIVRKAMKEVRKGFQYDSTNERYDAITDAYANVNKAENKKAREEEQAKLWDYVNYDPNDPASVAAVSGKPVKEEESGLSVSDWEKLAKDYIKQAKDEDENDEDTIELARKAVENALAGFFDPDEGVGYTGTVDDVIKVINEIEAQNWNNPAAMRKALEDYGFSKYASYSGFAADLTQNWSDDDKIDLALSLGDTKLIENADKSGEFDKGYKDIFGNAAVTGNENVHPYTKLDRADFNYALDWAKEQIADGKIPEGKAYNILAGLGFQDELEHYIPKQWHEAHYRDVIIPKMFEESGGDVRAMWEGMTEEERAATAQKMVDELSDQQMAEIFSSPTWWKSNPTVYRTFGQAFEQQLAGMVPTFASGMIADGAVIADAIGAAITDRPAMKDSTNKLLEAQRFAQNYGSVYDGANGAEVASFVTDAANEVMKMMLYGNIGGGIGSAISGAVGGTAVGSALSKALSSTKVLKWVPGFFSTMLNSTPFMASSFAGHYAEAKQMGATNAEAAKYGTVMGVAEGVLEGANFDYLWGRALGANKFGEMLTKGAALFKESDVIAAARVANMAASFAGEATEEGLGYFGETLWKMNSRWGRDSTEFSASDMLKEALMGGAIGLLGSAMSVGEINRHSILVDYWANHTSLPSDIVDVATGEKVFKGGTADERVAWENGDTHIMSAGEFAENLYQLDVLNKTEDAKKAQEEHKKRVDEANKKYNAVKAIETNLRAEASALDPSDPEYASKLADLNSKIRKAAQDSHDASLVREDEITKSENAMDARIEAESRQREAINKAMRDHWAGIYLQNKAEVASRDYVAIRKNWARDRQDGATVTPESRAQAAEQRAQSARPVDVTQGNGYNNTITEEANANGRQGTEAGAGNESQPGRYSGVSGQAVSVDNQVLSGEGRNGRANPRWIESVPVTEKAKANGIDPVELRTDNNDPSSFHAAIGEAKASNDHGAFVDQHDVDEYGKMRTFMSADGGVGVAVTDDGDIVSVFKNPEKNKSKKSSTSILFTALENGGKKLDNFNSNTLSQIYLQHGFVPVARIKFNDDYAPDGWNYERDGRPDILFWVHNGDDANTILDKMGTYEMPDVESLPLFEGENAYDEAKNYRDSLVDEKAGWPQQTVQIEQAATANAKKVDPNAPWTSKQTVAETRNARPFTAEDEQRVIDAAKQMHYNGKITFVDDPDAQWEGEINLETGDIVINRAKLTATDTEHLAENPAMWVMEHELFHDMWNKGGETVDELRAAVREIYKKHPGIARGNADANYDRFLDKVIERRNAQGLSLSTRAQAEEEVVGDFFRNYAFRSDESIKALCEANGNIGQQILSWLRYKINDLKLRRSKDPWARDILRVERQYALALREANKRPHNKARAKDSSASGNVVYNSSTTRNSSVGNITEEALNDAFIEDIDEIDRLLGWAPDATTVEAPVVFDDGIDTNGNRLSDEQKSYFADSKVRSRNGQLRPVYHYTNSQFTEFLPMDASSGSRRTHGDGYYFSTSEDEFSHMGRNKMVMYANVTNPFEMELTPEQAGYVYDKYAAPFHEDKFGLYREHAIGSLQSSYKVFDYLKEYAEQNGIGTSDILRDLGFDGVHDGSEWVAFDSNQLKFTDNKTPTEANDLRFSGALDIDQMLNEMSAEASDDEYMALARNAKYLSKRDMDEMGEMVDNAAKEKGYTIKAFHGTTDNFNEFSRGEQGRNHDGYLEFGAGFYFTPSEQEARQWVERGRSGQGGRKDANVMAVYLNPNRIIGADDMVPGGSEYLQRLGLGKADANFLANRVYRFINYLIDERGFSNVEAQDTMKALGFDAIDATFGNGASGQYVVFDPEQIKSADPITYDDDGNIIPLSQRFDEDSRDIRYSGGDATDDTLNEFIDQYGAQPQGREPRASDVRVPNQVNDATRVSRFGRSVMESRHMTDDMRKTAKEMMVSQNWLSYTPTTNAESMAEARNFIAARQPLEAQADFHDMVMQGKFGKKTNAIGLQLLADASERGDVDSFYEIATDLQIAATEAGQSAQIFNVLKELKGVGSAYYMQRVVDRLNGKYDDLIQKGKMNRIVVSPELMNKLSQARTVDQIAEAEEAVAKEIAAQIPLTWTDRLSNWRYFSMLGNPVTHARNMFGNLLMKGMNTAKDTVATGIESAAERAGWIDAEDRAHSILSSADKATWSAFADASYNEQARNLSGGGKLGFETFVKQNMRKFDTKWVDALARFNFKLLEGEDIMFIRPAYKNALMQYMKAQGFTLNEKGQAGKVDAKGVFHEMTNAQQTAAVEWASQQAWKQTFRDASSLATMLNKLSKENAVSKLLVEGVMPFKKTPINIAKRGLEYSPAGIIMGTVQLATKVKQGKMSAATAIDNLASGITGTALMALGVFLAKAGLIRAGGEDKKKYETFLQDTGDQTYSFKFGDVSINMSSIAPATIPLFMGVALQEMTSRNDGDVDLSAITDIMAGTLNPFMEMSFMSSLNSALQNYNNEGIGGALGNTLLTAAQNYGSQYLPTLGGKIAQFFDPTRRTTKSDATSPIGGNMDYYMRSLAKKVPGLEATLQPDVDIWGRTDTKDSFGDWALDFANKFILPTSVKVSNRDAVDNELIRVVESTGVTDFLPSDGNKYFTVKGERYNMNARQYAQYSQDRGQASYAALKEVMQSAVYKSASDDEKAAMLEKALKAAQTQVNTKWKEILGVFDD